MAPGNEAAARPRAGRVVLGVLVEEVVPAFEFEGGIGVVEPAAAAARGRHVEDGRVDVVMSCDCSY